MSDASQGPELAFFAHSSPSGQWQALESHLLAVASAASSFGASFSSADWAYLAGLWHDLGKYQPEFQARLRGASVTVEHSGAGAALACSKHREQGLALAFCIAGHHAGLANLIDASTDPRPLAPRLEENHSLLDRIRQSLPPPLIDCTLPPLPDFLLKPSADFDHARRIFEFWTRMLFSCLVDADFLDTELFLDPSRAALRRQSEGISQLKERLNRQLDLLIAGLPPDRRQSPVNQARRQVLDLCRTAAALPPGFFSLTVPTGGGKTLSAMAFALGHAAAHGLRRVIAVLPYTSIIEQNAAVYRNALGNESVIEHHSNLASTAVPSNGEVRQFHELACENWDAPVIVTTTVQFFESLFANRTSGCRKLHNIAQSVIALDEVQTLPTHLLHPILDALNQLVAHYGCTVLLTTATPPSLARRPGFPQGLHPVHEIIPDPQALASTLRRVTYSWPTPEEAQIEWPALAAELATHRQVLAVVHRREDAWLLCSNLSALVEPASLFHLSALMCPQHRSDVITAIRARLAHDLPCRVVSTQLVEAGVDFDFPFVYRSLAGLDSIVQAAGRCNREGRLTSGAVRVFRPPTRPPAPSLRRAAEITEQLLIQNGNGLDPSTPATIDDFFRRLYFTENLDARNIQALRAGLNFASTAHEFQLIEDGATEPVIVPYDGMGYALARLLQAPKARELRRALQRFSLQVYPQTLAQLRSLGAVSEPAPGLTVLAEIFHKLYDTTYGLRITPTAAPDPAALIK